MNASPDIRQQIAATPALHPRGLRHSPIKAVLLTNGDVDHVAGLLSLREGQPFALYGTPDVLDAIAGNPVFDVMARSVVSRRPIALDDPFMPIGDLRVTLFPVPGKVPLWQESGTPVIGEETGTTVGAMIESGGRRLAYVPGCAMLTEAVRRRFDGIDVLLFDGTVLADDDLIRAGVGEKSGWRMGHVPMTGDSGSIRGLAELRIGEKIFVHINNTNPVLIEDSAERRLVERAGWRVAHDGMTVGP